MPYAGSTFETTEPSLSEMLQWIDDGTMQLPDFQRGWVWDDDHIRSLIASVSLSYPIGAVMLLAAGSDGVRFRPRLVEGVPLSRTRLPERYILDGQQRLTSLYLALKSDVPVQTRTDKGQEIRRFYYLDMGVCLKEEADRIEAVRSLPEDRVVRSDFGRQIELDVSTREKEYENDLFPLTLAFEVASCQKWQQGYRSYHRYDPDKMIFLDDFVAAVWQRFQQYRVPVITLQKETPKEAVCQVFEKVNTGGVSLSVFELMTATFAADNFALRDDWEMRCLTLQEHPVLQGTDATAFLTSTTLLTTWERSIESGSAVSCKRKDVLRLSLDEYQRNADRIVEGFVKAARFLAREKVFDTNTLPYTTQLIPLAAICAALGDRFESEAIRRKLARWYWCGVFGELYGGANETRMALDLPEMIRWIDMGNEDPRTVRDAVFSPMRLLSLQTRQSAAYKGTMALLMQNNGSQDFLSGDTIELASYFDLAVDIHHIFPRYYCETNKLPRSWWNSVINKAPLSGRTNRIIGGRAPSGYLRILVENHDAPVARLNEILSTHQIDPPLLRNDEFSLFIRDRARRLLDLIEKAMGKEIVGRESEEVIAEFGESLIHSQVQVAVV